MLTLNIPCKLMKKHKYSKTGDHNHIIRLYIYSYIFKCFKLSHLMLKSNQNVLKSLRIASVRQRFGDGSKVLCSAQRSSQHLRSPQINTTFQVKHKQKNTSFKKNIYVSQVSHRAQRGYCYCFFFFFF